MAYVLVFALCIAGISAPAQARLGEEFAVFQARILRDFESVGQKGTNFYFKLKLSPRQQQIAPGYAAALTTTVVNGRITGESIAYVFGKNRSLGCTLATFDAFAFTCEAAGKPLPQDKKQGKLEFTAFAKIVENAFNGQPQSYSYPGYAGKIHIVADRTGKLIIACAPAPVSSPHETQPPASPTSHRTPTPSPHTMQAPHSASPPPHATSARSTPPHVSGHSEHHL